MIILDVDLLKSEREVSRGCCTLLVRYNPETGWWLECSHVTQPEYKNVNVVRTYLDQHQYVVRTCRRQLQLYYRPTTNQQGYLPMAVFKGQNCQNLKLATLSDTYISFALRLDNLWTPYKPNSNRRLRDYLSCFCMPTTVQLLTLSWRH